MPFPTLPDPAGDRAHEHARWHPERETLELAMAGAAKVLGPDTGFALDRHICYATGDRK